MITRKTFSVSMPDGTNPQITTTEFRFQVWKTLEIVNSATGRMVSVNEVADEYAKRLTPPLSPLEVRKQKDAIGQALQYFVKHNLVFTAKHAKCRLYASPRILSEATVKKVETVLPIRQRLLILIRQVVAHHKGKPVRCRDISEYADSFKIEDFTKDQIKYHTWSLVRTNELKIAGRTRGDGAGRTLFLPVEAESPSPDQIGTLTFVDLVFDIFTQLFEERVAQAGALGKLIVAPSTGEIQERLKKSPLLSRFAKKRDWSVTNVLNQLAKKQNPEIRSVVQSNKLKLWIPIAVSNEALDLENTYTSNALKIQTAVERAYLRFGERPVNLREVREEISNDENLRLSGKDSLSQQLICLARRKKLSERGNLRQYTFTETIRWFGSVGSRMYVAPVYASTEKSDNYIEFLKINFEWENLKKIENPLLIAVCRIASVQTGRALLFLQEVEGFVNNLLKINGEDLGRKFEVLREELFLVKTETNNLLDQLDRSELPGNVNNLMTGLSCFEANDVLSNFYPPSEVEILHEKHRSKHSLSLVGKVRNLLRQIPNPQFQSKHSLVPNLAAQNLFELTDFLQHTALRWGGDECRYQAYTSKQELGNLRDPRFLMAALHSSDFEQRTAAIACLAFLRKGFHELRNSALNDPIENVRLAALWAYSFMEGKDYQKLAGQVAGQAFNTNNIRFAERIATSTSQIEVWQM